MPNAAVDLPLPVPVCTIRRPRSSVLVAQHLASRAPCCRCHLLAVQPVDLVFVAHRPVRHRRLARGVARGCCCGAAATGRARSPRGTAPAISRERRRIVRGDEVAHRLVAEIGRRTAHRNGESSTAPRRGGEGEQVIDGRRDLGGALVAVPHDPGDPARVGGAAAHDAADLLSQGADARPVGLRMIVVIDRRPRAPTDAGPRRPARPRTGNNRRCRADRARGCPGCAIRRRRRRAAPRTGRARALPSPPAP